MTQELALRRRPLVCLVTDARIWARGASETETGAPGGRAWHEVLERMRALAAAATRAGIDLVQVRERGRSARELMALVETCVEIARGTDTMIIVNERTDVALAARAHGVHLRASSLAAAALRPAVPPGFVIGRSVHDVQEIAAGVAAATDYLLAGTVFPSRSKGPDAPLLGPGGLRRMVVASPVPVLAIGGLTDATAGVVAACGAAGMAAIDVFADEWQAQGSLGGVTGRIRAAFVSRGRAGRDSSLEATALRRPS